MGAVYPKCLEAMWAAGIDASAGDVALIGVDNTFVYDATHQWLSDITGIIGSESAFLTTKAFTDGEFTADPTALPGITLGQTLKGIVAFIDSGSPSTSPLICCITQNGDTSPISVPGNGTDIAVSLGANRVARLLAS